MVHHEGIEYELAPLVDDAMIAASRRRLSITEQYHPHTIKKVERTANGTFSGGWLSYIQVHGGIFCLV